MAAPRAADGFRGGRVAETIPRRRVGRVAATASPRRAGPAATRRPLVVRRRRRNAVRAQVRPFDANENYYGYLGLSGTCTADQVRRAYKRMCLKYHPDKLRQGGRAVKTGGKKEVYDEAKAAEAAKETFLKVQEAFEILGDQATRRQYDRQRISEEELDKQPVAARIRWSARGDAAVTT